SAFGFELVAYRGPETGVKDKVSYVLEQNKVRFVLTTSLLPDSAISEHVKIHGDGVKVLAITVDDAEKSFNETVKRGARPAQQPEVLKDDQGEIKTASICTYGDTIHTFVERHNYRGDFMPGFRKKKSSFTTKSVGLKHVDHCVGNVYLGEMDKWVKFYEDVMGFKLLL